MIDRFENVRQWAIARDLYTSGSVLAQTVKMTEELGEFSHALLRNRQSEMKDSLGDMFVVLVNLAGLSGFTLEDCIDSAFDEIKDRTGSMVRGNYVKDEK